MQQYKITFGVELNAEKLCAIERDFGIPAHLISSISKQILQDMPSGFFAKSMVFPDASFGHPTC